MTIKTNWQRMAQATDKTAEDAYTYTIASASTWATSSLNPENWPTAKASEGVFGFVEVPAYACSARLRFGISDANNEKGSVCIWGKDDNGSPILLLELTAITAGAALISKDPASGTTLTDFRLADSVTITSGLLADESCVSAITDGLAEVEFPLKGFSQLVADSDIDANSGTCEDMITWIKWVSGE